VSTFANGDSQVDQWQFNKRIESVRHFGLIYSIMKILVLFIEAMEVKAAGQPVEQGCSNCVFDNALNYISELFREKMNRGL
jgi:hypothetical protein